MPFQIISISYRSQAAPLPPVGSPAFALTGSFPVGVPITTQDVFFSTDGTKMYIAGQSFFNSTYEIYQYDLSVAWDETSHDNNYQAFSVTAQDDWVGGITFSTDGTKMYIAGASTLKIFQYTLSTPWDLSTASIDQVGSPAVTVEYDFGFGPPYEPSGITFNTDNVGSPAGPPAGTKMFVTDGDSGGHIYQYTLSTPWDVSSASYDTALNIYTGDYNSNIVLTTGVQFNGDGTNMFVIASYNSDVVQWTLSTPYDLTSVVHYTYNRKWIEYDDYTQHGVFVKPDGTTLYAIGSQRNRVLSYTMSDPWNLISLKRNNSKGEQFDITGDYQTDLFMDSSGTRLYMVDYYEEKIYQFSLATPWDISSATYEFKFFNYNDVCPDVYGFTLSDDGSKLYIMDSYSSTSRIHQFTLTTPWDISTVVNDFKNYLVSYGFGVRFKSDGTEMYTADGWNTRIRQDTLSIPWDVTSASFTAAVGTSTQTGSSISGMAISSDGLKVYVVDFPTIYQYSLSPAWDLSTMSYDSISYTSNFEDDGSNDGIWFKPDGTKMYKIGTSSISGVAGFYPSIYEYDLGTPWNVSTAVSGVIGVDVSGTRSLNFSPDGTKIFAGDWNPDDLTQYTMSGSPLYDLTSATYVSASYYVNPEEASPRGVAFSNDGLTMFVVGSSSDRVHQYSLSNAWEVATATYTGLNYSVGSTTPEDVTFSTDGLTMYVIKSSPDLIYQYALTNPWDFTVAPTFTTSVASGDGTGTGVVFKSDGTMMFVSGDSSNDITSFVLGTPWLVSSAGSAVSKSVGSMILNGVFLSPDGTKFYIVNDSSNRIEQWTMSTPWDVSTAVSDGSGYYYSVSTACEGLFFSPDGLYLYTIDISADRVYEHHLSVAWDLSTAASASPQATLTGTNDLMNIHFRPDGTVFYELADNGNVIQYTPSSAWDLVATANDGTVYNVTTDVPAATTPKAFAFNSSGTRMYVLDDATTTIYQYDITPAWTFSGSPDPVSYNGVSYDVSSLDGDWSDLKFSPDGTKLYIMGFDSSRIHQFSLGTPWDLSTVVWDRKTFPTKITSRTPYSFDFSNDGSILFVGDDDKEVKSFVVSTPWDLSTAQYPHTYYRPGCEGTTPTSVLFSDDGLTMYVLADESHKVYQLALGTAWDPSTANSPVGSPATGIYLPLAVDDIESGMSFGDSGTKLYIVGGLNSAIYQYTLSVAWDLSTATYDSIQFNIEEDFNPQDVIFNSTGTSMYVLGGINRAVYQYTLSVGWDLSTASIVATGSPIVGSPLPVAFVNVGADAPLPLTIDISGDGTKLFVFSFGGIGNYDLVQYNLSTPWDITTATYSGSRFNNFNAGLYTLHVPYAMKFNYDGTKIVAITGSENFIIVFSTNLPWEIQAIREDETSTSAVLQGRSFSNITFKTDGTKMYIVEGSNINQYTLSTPFDISTALYDNLFFYNDPQTSNANDVEFDSTGTRMYIVGDGFAYSYTLSTAWDVTTALYDFSSIQIDLNTLSPQDFVFGSSGTKAYVIDDTTNNIYQYALDAAWDTSSGYYEFESYTLVEDATPVSLSFNSTGTKMYVIGDTNNTVYQYTLSTPWNVSSASYDTVSLDVSTEDALPVDIRFNDDGTKMYIIGATNNAVYQYTLSVGWDLSTASADTSGSPAVTVSLIVGVDSAVVELAFDNTGTKLFFLGDTSNTAYSYTLSIAWDISTAVSDTKFIAVDGQDTQPQGVTFSADGTKMYMVGGEKEAVYQYTASVAWDASTAAYDNVSIPIQDSGSVRNLIFTPDGTILYVMGVGSILRYDLSIAWDLSTAVAAAKKGVLNRNLPSTETAPYGIYIKSDGTALYAVGSTRDRVSQYSMSPAWDITTIEYVDPQFYPGDSTPRDVFFKPDGTEMYVVGDTGNRIYQSTLTTPWDLSTATIVKNVGVGGEDTTPMGVFFKSDGLKMYVVGDTTNSVYQYTLSVAWDVTTATVDTVGSPPVDVSVGAQTTSPSGVTFKSDGTKMYVMDWLGSQVIQFTLSSAWDLTTAAVDTVGSPATNVTFDVSSEELAPHGVRFKTDGTKMYVMGTNERTVFEYTLLTPWDISTAQAYDSSGETTLTAATIPEDIAFNPDGTLMYVSDGSTDFAYQFDLVGSPAYDISTATLSQAGSPLADVKIDTSPPDSSMKGIAFKTDGTKMYMAGDSTNRIYQYTLSTPWDLSTAAVEQTGSPPADVYFQITGMVFNNPSDVSFNSDGTAMYITSLSTGDRKVFQYALSTPWEVTTAVYVTSFFSVASQSTSPIGLEFNNDGTKMYITDSSGDVVYEYDLAGSPAWDIESAVVSSNTLALRGETTPTGIALNATGTRMYIVGSITNKIYQFDLGVAYDVSSATFVGAYSILYTPDSVEFNSTGTQMYILSLSNIAYRYALSSAWDVTTATFDGYSFDGSSEDGGITGIFVSSDDTKLYFLGNDQVVVYEYDL